MATSFKIIREYIRAALLDTDKDCYVFSDDALNQQINFANLLVGYDIDETGQIFEATLTARQKLKISLEAAINILSGLPDTFEYKSPVMSVKRGRFKGDLLTRLRTLLSDSEGGRFSVSVDTDFDAIIQSFNRYYSSLNNGESAWSGIAT